MSLPLPAPALLPLFDVWCEDFSIGPTRQGPISLRFHRLMMAAYLASGPRAWNSNTGRSHRFDKPNRYLAHKNPARMQVVRSEFHLFFELRE